MARLAVPAVADWCAVDMRAGEELERVAVEHVDPAPLALARAVQERYPADRRLGDRRLGRAATRLRRADPGIPDDLLVQAAVDDEHLQLLRSVGLRSAMLAPMTLRDEVLGVISFVSAEVPAGGSTSTTSRWPRTSRCAPPRRSRTPASSRPLRRSRTPCSRRCCRPCCRTSPAWSWRPPTGRPARATRCGGDFYDVFNTAGDQWYLVIGDVCGKGAEAAAVTALARYTIRAAAVRRRSPAAILRWLSDAMIHQSGGNGRFCTIACQHSSRCAGYDQGERRHGRAQSGSRRCQLDADAESR